jgi:hypothetical protein
MDVTRSTKIPRMTKPIVSLVVLAGLLLAGGRVYQEYVLKTETLKKIIARLEADSRIAEVMVTEVTFNPILEQHMTTIKFLEYGSDGRPQPPKYFTFSGNIIQFQSLVIRFDDKFVEAGDLLRGKSIYLFWKVFMLDGKNTQEYPLATLNEVPQGYKIDGPRNPFEERLWKEFWACALDSKKAISQGIKNAQIEAPGTRFVPGLIYTLRIEHDGGIRIDAQELPAILKGETIAK